MSPSSTLFRFSHCCSLQSPLAKQLHSFKNGSAQPVLNSNLPFSFSLTTSATKISPPPTEISTFLTGNHSSFQEAFETLGMSKRSINLLIQRNPDLSTLPLPSFSSTISVLHSLQITNDRLLQLIKKHPIIFTLDLDLTLYPTISSIPDLNTQKLSRILFNSNPRIFTSLPSKISLLTRYGFSESEISTILNNINLKPFLEKPLSDLDSTLQFLQTLENKTHPSLLLRHPPLLLLDLETEIKPLVAFFRSLVSDSGALKKLLWRFPVKRWFTVEYLENHIHFFRSNGFTGGNIQVILRSYPQIFTLSIDRKIKPKIEFLSKCGLDRAQIVKILTAQPSFLGLSFDNNVSKKAEFLTALGFRPYSTAFARTLSTVTRIGYGKLTATVELLMSYGLSREDLCRMCEKQPHVLRYTCECLGPKMKYLVKEMGLELGVLVEFPTCLGYSLENRIKPRHEAMTWLVKRGLKKEGYSVNRLFSLSNRDFERLTAGTGFCESSD